MVGVKYKIGENRVKDKLPNFLIVGAAKSGTTSLYHYLKQHPEIYMSPVKEPKFITAQFLTFPFKGIGDEKVEQNIIKSYNEYCNLFKGVSKEKIIGEASPDNLYYYEKAITIIIYHFEKTKIIIILRNPIERAFSAYMYFINCNREYLSFEEALKEEERRRNNNWELFWYYKDLGFYYHQVKAYLDNFDQVKIYLYDDLRKDPLGLIKDMYGFLGVDTSFIPDISIRYNVSGTPKNKFIYKFLKEPNILKTIVKPAAKFLIPKDRRREVIEKIKMKNLQKPQMKPETREYLKNLYREDILKLQDLIKRDLSSWLE